MGDDLHPSGNTSKLGVSNHVLRVSEVIDGATLSFQAKLYRLGEDRVAKVYGRELVWDRIELDNPRVRMIILERELHCLRSLSAGLAPALEIVELPDGWREFALTMKRLDPADFLERRFERGEVLPEVFFSRLASMLVGYHFDAGVCPMAKLEAQGLPLFLRSLLGQERDILLNVLRAKELTATSFASLYDVIDDYIRTNEYLISELQHTMGEPIVGHGDLKSQNVVFVQDEGTVFVVDSAPLPEWRVNTRRMDALFFDTELRLIGRDADADVFWSAYDGLYRETARRFAGGAHVSDGAIQVVDTISRFYRANIFLRLAHIGVNPQRAGKALGMMEGICASL